MFLRNKAKEKQMILVILSQCSHDRLNLAGLLSYKGQKNFKNTSGLDYFRRLVNDW